VKHLQSPWRSAYIGTFKGEKKSKECLFCRIAKERKDAENLLVWRGRSCFVVLNRYPYNSGHVMIVPYRHLSSFAALKTAEMTEVMKVTAKCLTALEKTSAPHGFNFGANLGRVAGAGIEDHVHFHLVPRWNGDTNFMPVLAEVKVVSERLEELWEELRKILSSQKAKVKRLG
jgi:ATP adenylyltransferase